MSLPKVKKKSIGNGGKWIHTLRTWLYSFPRSKSYLSLNIEYALTFITQRAENPVKPTPSLPLKPSLANVIKEEMQLFRQQKQVRLSIQNNPAYNH